MKPRIAIWYHVKLHGGNPPVSPQARTIMAEQMDLLVNTGLYEMANLLTIGINGELGSCLCELPPGAEVIYHGDDAQSELPTMWHMQQWLPGHEDWYVLYFHAKGARDGRNPLNIIWRRCMERAVIDNWPRCLKDLNEGADTVGAHWLTQDQYPTLVKTWFWGGNFWWAKASFLAELPPLPKQPKCRDDFFIAENWIGFGRRPAVKDYRPHWPGLVACLKL